MNRQMQQPEKKQQQQLEKQQLEKQQLEKKELKFYQTKMFRALIAVALAALLLGNSAIDNISSLFATEGVMGVEEEAIMPEPASEPAPEPKSEPAPQPEPQPEPQPQPEPEAESQPEPAAEPQPEPRLPTDGEPEAEGETGEEAAEGLVEGLDEETVEATEETAEETGAGNPLADAIAVDGIVYIKVNGDLFSSTALRSNDHMGRVSGIAIATAYHEADGDAPATVYVTFATNDALVKGYMDAASVTLLERDEAIATIGEDGVREYTSAAWPLPAIDFELAKAEKTEPAEALASEEPVITLSSSIEGGRATITAQVEGIPEGTVYTLQWQNNISGEFADVPGETGVSITFDATEENLRCAWRVALVVEAPASEE